MGLLGGLYRGVFKRTSTFTAAICIGAIGVSDVMCDLYVKLETEHTSKISIIPSHKSHNLEPPIVNIHFLV